MTHAVAAALRLQQQQGLGIEDTVIEYLRTRELLLVVDNCEHVLDDAARLLDQIAAHCPRVSVLATSREALGVEGERIMPVEPLSVDDATDAVRRPGQGEQAGLRPGARAGRRGRRDLPPTRRSAAGDRAGGGPDARDEQPRRGAAAGRVASAQRWRPRRDAAGNRASRRRSTGPIDCCPNRSRRLFARLSVFAGGFDLDAAHGVCGEDGTVEDDTLDLLTGLVDKSMVVVRGGADRTRYGVLETLRAYGRERLRENGIEDRPRNAARRVLHRHWPSRPPRGCTAPTSAAWVLRMLPDYDNLRAAFEHAMSAGDIDLAMRLVTSLPEFVHLRIGYEASGWAERALDEAGPDHALFAAAVGFAARGAWNRGDFDRARSIAMLAQGRVPDRGNGRVAYPGDVLADLALYEGDATAALGALRRGDGARPRRRRPDPLGVDAVLRGDLSCGAARSRATVSPPQRRRVAVADTTANPTARSMARYALGLVLKKSEPDRALALFDEAAELAESVQNFWWHGIALMEAASTRAVHGDPASAASELITVIDHWDRVGDWSQQWLNLRYVTRFLVRVGAHDDALALHRALVGAGRQSPLSAAQLASLGDGQARR